MTLPSKLVVSRKLTDGDKMTYAALQLWGGVDGRAFPSRERLAEARHVGPATLYRHLAALEQGGWIRREREPLGGGRYRHVIHVLAPLGRPSPARPAARGLSPARPPDSRQRETERDPRKDTPPSVQTSGTGAAPVSEVPTARGRAAAEAFARTLSRSYPHGWSNSGTVRAPNLKRTAEQLLKKHREGHCWEAILGAAKAFARVVGGTDDQQYTPALFRWVRDDGFLEVPARRHERPARPEPTPEELEARAQADARSVQERLEKEAARAAAWRGR